MIIVNHKDYTNSEISEFLIKISTAYEIKNKSRFQISAYKNAADVINTYPQSLYEIWKNNPQKLDSIPNIGPSIYKKIDYLFRYHKLYPSLNQVFKNIHPAVFIFTKINNVGPLISHKLTTKLKFSSNPDKALKQLLNYAQKHKIRQLPSFGEKSENLILDNTISFLGRKNRMSLKTAQSLSHKIIKYMQFKFPHLKFIPLGSLRRESDTIGDIDIAVAANNPRPILSHFINYPDSIQLINSGKNKASLRLNHDIHIDLMIKPTKSFGALLQHFTGSRQHNILLRKHALKLGYSLSEYGIKNKQTGHVYQFKTENEFYSFLDLNYIPPSKRTGENELEIYKK